MMIISSKNSGTIRRSILTWWTKISRSLSSVAIYGKEFCGNLPGIVKYTLYWNRKSGSTQVPIRGILVARINKKDRIIYKVYEVKVVVHTISIIGHYDDK